MIDWLIWRNKSACGWDFWSFIESWGSELLTSTASRLGPANAILDDREWLESSSAILKNNQKSQEDKTNVNWAMSEGKVSESALFINIKGHQSFPSSLRCTSTEVLSLMYSGAYFYISLCLNIDELSFLLANCACVWMTP